MTWGEFAWSVEGYRQRELDEWKRFRALMLQNHNMNTKHPIRDPEIFMRLETKETPKVVKKAPKLTGEKKELTDLNHIYGF